MSLRVARWFGLATALGLGWCLVIAGCDPDPFPNGSDGLDDGISNEAPTETMCSAYPTAANNFDVGSIIRNYGLFDMEDDDAEICEFSKPSATLLFLALTAES